RLFVRLACKLRTAAHDLQKHVLKDVVCVVAAACLRIGKTVDHVPVRPDKLLRGLICHAPILLSPGIRRSGVDRYMNYIKILLAIPAPSCYSGRKEGIIMYEAFEENRQPLYQDLRLYWLLMLLVDVLGLLDSTVVSIISVILG